MVLDNHVPVQQKLHISSSSSYFLSYSIPSEFSFHAYEKFCRVSTYDVFNRWILKFYRIRAYIDDLNPLYIRKLKYEDTCSHSVGFCKSWKMNRMRYDFYWGNNSSYLPHNHGISVYYQISGKFRDNLIFAFFPNSFKPQIIEYRMQK